MKVCYEQSPSLSLCMQAVEWDDTHHSKHTSEDGVAYRVRRDGGRTIGARGRG
jgi:hypothetical protein